MTGPKVSKPKKTLGRLAEPGRKFAYEAGCGLGWHPVRIQHPTTIPGGVARSVSAYGAETPDCQSLFSPLLGINAEFITSMV